MNNEIAPLVVFGLSSAITALVVIIDHYDTKKTCRKYGHQMVKKTETSDTGYTEQNVCCRCGVGKKLDL